MIADDVRLRYLVGDVFAYPDGGTLLCAPGGRTLRVNLDQARLSALLANCDGSRTVAELSADDHDGELKPFLAKLVSIGCLGPANETDRAADSAMRRKPYVALYGDSRLTSLAGAIMGDGAELRASGIPSQKCLGASIKRLPETAVPVFLILRPDYELLGAIEDACLAARKPWSQLHLMAGSAWFGPHVVPGTGPGIRDLIGRRLAAVRDPASITALTRPSAEVPPPLSPRHWLMWALSVYVNDLLDWLDGEPALAAWHEVELQAPTKDAVRHPVLPIPGRAAMKAPDHVRARGVDLLVDGRTGIVTRLIEVTHHPSIPSRLRTVHATTCHLDRISPWRNDPVAGGSAFDDISAARAAAIGEAVERYCGNIIQEDRLIRASFTELRARGECAVDPDSLVLFSQRQYAARGFPFVPFSRDLAVFWVPGRTLSDHEAVWLPASLVYPNWHVSRFADEPKTNGTFFPGLAAGRTLESALSAGIQETIERHATMVWWLNAQPLPTVRLPADLADFWQGTADLKAWVIHLDNVFGIPVMAGIVENQADCILTAGFAARSDPRAAILKAWSEACTLQDISRDLLNPQGARWTAARGGQINGSGLKPWRADRRYLDDYRADNRDVVDLICQVQAWLDPRAPGRIRAWAQGPPAREISDLPSLTDGDLGTYQRAVKRQGYEVYYADITTPDVALAGLTVVRVLIPGLVPNSPAAFPYLGRAAVQQAAVDLGWRDTIDEESCLNYLPMPHA